MRALHKRPAPTRVFSFLSHFRHSIMRRKRLQTETIGDSGCVRAARRKLRGRIRMWIYSFYLYIERSRPHLSGDKRVQLPFMVIVIMPASQTGKTAASDHLSPGVTCAHNSYPFFWEMGRFLFCHNCVCAIFIVKISLQRISDVQL